MPHKFWVKILPKVSDKNADIYSKCVRLVLSVKGVPMYRRLQKHMLGTKILDVGVGIGGVSHEFKKHNYEVSGIDVEDLSVIKESTPKIYNGTDIPFENNKFDTALLIHVLHHCSNPDKVLSEAKRVSKRVVFIEDTYRNKLEKVIVSLDDMIGNAEYYEHQYKTPDQWRKFIKDKNWKLVAEEEFSEIRYGLYGRYYLAVVE